MTITFLWISTSSGNISKYDINKNSLLFFRDNEPYPIGNQLWSLTRDRNGLFWLGSWEGGLKCFNPDGNKFTSYKTTNGLPSNNILSVLEDNEYNLWLGTDRGLVRLTRHPEM